jgi:hypothetical protein
LIVDLNCASGQVHRLRNGASSIFKLQVHQRYVDNLDNLAIDEGDADAFKIHIKQEGWFVIFGDCLECFRSTRDGIDT